MTRILAALLLAALVAAMACGRRGNDVVTVSALLRADTLLSPEVNRADSALALLEAIDTAALATDGDRALYALLLTQALYKLTDDPIDTVPILRAVDYYATAARGGDHHVRALTYAGAAAESNGDPIAAMRLYKTAELAADTSSGDTVLLRDLAYAKLRIGSLMSTQLNEEKREIEILKEALRIFSRIKDMKYITATIFDIGTSYALTDFDSSRYYITRALELTKVRRDTAFMYDCFVRLAQIHAMGFRDYGTAMTFLDSAMAIIPDKDAAALLCRSLCLARTGNTDEASQMLEQSRLFPYSRTDSIACHKAMEAIASAKHNEQDAEFHRTRAQQMTELLEIASKPLALNDEAMSVQNRFQTEKLKRDALMWQIPACAIALIVILAVALAWRRHQLSSRVVLEELRGRIASIEQSRAAAETTIRNVSHELEKAQAELADSKTSDAANVRRVDELNKHMSLQRDLIGNLIRQRRLLSEVNEHIYLKGKQKGLGVIFAVLGDELKVSELPDSFWNDIFEYVDSTHNGLLSHIKTAHTDVSDKEMRLICLSAIGLSNTIIAKCLDYTNTQSVRNIKSVLPKRKMNIDVTVENLLSMWRSEPRDVVE